LYIHQSSFPLRVIYILIGQLWLNNALYSKNLDKRSLDKLKKLSSSTKENIRALALAPRNRGFKQKRILLAQSGSGIGTVIASVLPLLLSLFTKK